MIPLVSVVIPCYNSEKYVRETIESALGQTYPSCEIIVVDDGSTDGSLDVIKGFGDAVRWESGPNRGACAARNRGAELSKGQYLQFLDADDIIEPEKIQRQVALLIASRNRAVCGSRWCHFRDEIRDPAIPSSPPLASLDIGLNLSEWVEGKAMQFPAMWLIPAELVKTSGGWDETLLRNQDLDFIANVLMHADEIIFEPETIAYYRIGNSNSISQSTDRREAKEMSQLESFRKIVKASSGGKYASVIRRASSVAAGNLALVTAFPLVRQVALKMWHEWGGARPRFVCARTGWAKLWFLFGLDIALLMRGRFVRVRGGGL